ncbi:MAG: ABC-2 transporter permease [Ruminococcus sp.]|uniref:ABC-2 transporter permease n=1 Tax=Ruminococcus sp. TaxID=41978 RepID=UPI00260148E5|nr:ABC-2 transporter permease [Ruminococcus sp.]MCR5600789.1 ABC-2 transporter permease [Ruminococcus sp.]
MKGLIYREFYLSRKSVFLMLLVYVLFVFMLSLVMISTYAGNLAKDPEADEMCEYLYSSMYIYAGFIAIIGVTYGHNDIIEKDYKSHWQLYSYTLPADEKKIITSKFVYRGILILFGFMLAVLADAIFSIAAGKPLSMSHFKNTLILLLGYGMFCMADIPMMLRFKTQGKSAAVIMPIATPFMAAFGYGTYRFVKLCTAEAKRLYPNMDGDAAMKKVAYSYIMPYRDIAVWILPVLAAAAVVLCYFWAIKEMKRRRY